VHSKPVIEPVVLRQLGPKEWGTETLFAHTDEYTGKILRMRAGASGPLQYHRLKDETFYLLSGRAIVRFDRGDGVLGLHQMLPGEAFHVPPGAVHQVEALEDCVFVEASNPVFDDRVNVEHEYP
jgi:mannose-6-phosphate isomerase